MSRVGIRASLVLALVALAVMAGCGEGEETTEGGTGQAQIERQAAQQRAAARRAKIRREVRAAELRQRRQAAARRRHRAEVRQVRAEEAEQRAAERAEEEAVEEEASECDPNYSGACLDPYAYDYDCEGGSGDGPEYTGPVAVVGEDHYELDADSDGTGCEPY
ncbi:MAG TPA: hypothetical protein VK480_09875 [Solirubrobacterales bacterium]|nr:hypothetical protein [Solirubrobacterales bacterium]